MVSLKALIELHESFDLPYGIGPNLIHYLARPRILFNSFNFEEAKRVLIERQHPDKLDIINMAPQDVSIFKNRAALLSSNNEAYRIATSDNPSIEDLVAFSYMSPGWAVLFSLKHYLIHHREKAKDFNGFLPYGSAVIAYINNLDLQRSKPITPTPSFADHVFLQKISNQEAQALGISSVEINNIMYIQGTKLIKKAATSDSVAE